MYRFEKKATLVCAAASLITACCLPLSANVAFAQDSVEAQSIESKSDFSSVVSDDLQPDNSSVIKDGWQRDESSGVWYYGKNGKHQTGWLQSGGYWYWLDPANDGAMQTGYFSVTDAGGSTTSLDRLLRFMRMTVMTLHLMARYIRAAGYVTLTENGFMPMLEAT